ncbi:RNA-dependent ATPase [Cryptotrichosporon argae]
MSNDADVQLSKEERKRLKEEKRARKAAKAAAAAATSVEVIPALVEAGTDKKEKKDKKDKKRSRNEDELEVAASPETKEDKPKKAKKAKAEVSDSTAAPAPAADANADANAPALSKKQQKKLLRAAEATTSSSSSSVPPAPAPAPAAFDAAHNAYLSDNHITLQPALFPPVLDIAALPLSAALRPYLAKFTKPTPIQACSWPALLAHRDVVGIAETGSGKTLSFGVPGLQHLSGLPKPSAKGKGKGKVAMLVLAPTRELAQQSFDTLKAFGAQVGIGAVAIFGGVGKNEQIAELRKDGVRIVVGTPGRTLDLADAGDLDLSAVSYLVLDEADRMLDQGFENDIRRIIAHTPDHTGGRQTVMFSATWPESVRRLASSFLHDPIRVTVGSDELSANKRIEQVVEVLDSSRDKDSRMLYHLRTHLKAHPNTRILVFGLYKKEAQRLEQTLRRAGHNVGALHGDMNQNDRFRALENFKNASVNVLVATDVAARGLDIPDVSLVVNVTFPLTTEDFVHRCGRTGRAGKTGKAVTFFTGEAHEKSLAGEFMRVLRDAGADVPAEMSRFPTTIKKKEHGSYGAFYKDTADAPKATKITFD